MTLLPSNPIGGLWIQPEGRDWMEVVVPPETYVVNSGDTLAQWTNDRFLSTKHRVANRAGVDRYAIPFFWGCNDDVVLEPLPTCVSDDRPARYEPITYGELSRWFVQRNYFPEES
jgi:isopenicillin N synthase-like dioxygenase